MPSILDAPVLQVDANVIHKVDTSNPQNLFSMWTVFARCADSVAQGRRLENLSWRLWTRETFCVEAAAARLSASTPIDSLESASIATLPNPKTIPRRNASSSEEVPMLSGSVESLADEETVDLGAVSGAVEIVRPRIRRQDSCASSRSRGRERHITSDDLEKMVVSIVQGKESLKTPLPQISSLSFASPRSTPASSEATSSSVQSLESVESAASSNEAEIESMVIQEEPELEHDDDATEAESASSSDDTLAPESVEASAAIESENEATPSIEITAPMARSTTTVIRGFSPSQIPVIIPPPIVPANEPLPTRRSEGALVQENAIPEPTSSPQAKPVQPKKAAATFALGGSSSGDDSSSDPSQSLEMRKTVMSQMMKRNAAVTNGVNGTNGSTASAGQPSRNGASEGNLMKSALHTSGYGRAFAQKKQTSFSSQVVTQTIPPPADDDSDSDDIDESAIDDDDDDSSDWEDSNEESRRSSIDDKTLFQRVDSKVHLPSRRSLITLMIQRSEQEVKNGLTTSQSTMALPRSRTIHQPPSLAPSPPEGDDSTLMMRHRSRGPGQPPARQSTLRPINEIPRSAAQPIMSTTMGGQYQAANSPRTNRRNMLSTELTESLRRHLLWERSQKTSTANAVLKRRHTAHDVANLKQYPEPVHMNKDNEFNTTGYDQYLNRDAFNGYHAKGW